MDSIKNLLIRFRNGDENAFNQLYSQYDALVKKCIEAYAKGVYKEEIDDIHQHFWVYFIQYSKNYDPTQSLEAWIVACAVKTVANYTQRNRLQKVKNKKIQNASDIEDGVNISVFDLPCINSKPQETLSQAEEFNIAKRGMSKISPAQQKILKRVCLQGETIAEYAKSEGLSSKGVYRAFRDAIKRLRETQEVKSLIACHNS